MKTLRLAVLASVVAVLTGCPGDKCKDVMCPTGQSCDPNSGMCVNGNQGGGSGGNGGNTGGNGGNTGGGSGGGTIDAGPPIPLNMLCQKVAETFCARQERCQTLDSRSRAACIADELETCTAARAVNAMVATYDPAAAAQCLGRIALQDCYDNSAPPDCALALSGGRGQAGNPCVANGDCQADAGLYCKAFQSCGTCTAFSQVGQPCNGSTASRPPTTCAPGLSCTSSTDGGTCAAPQPPGQPCNTTGTSTTNGLACQTDAGFCPPTPTDGGARLCQPFGMVGALCSLTSNCSSGLICNTATVDGGSARCEERRGAGLSCNTQAQCQTGLYCPPIGTVPRTCRALVADGQPCTDSIECTSANCTRDPDYYSFPVTDGGARTCGFLAANDPCWIDDDCGAGRHCKGFKVQRPDAGFVFGACAATDPDGGACTNSETRIADSCANPNATCLDGRCVETPDFSRMLGQSCEDLGFNSPCAWPTRCQVEDPYIAEGRCVTPMTRDAGEDCDFTVQFDCGVGQQCNFNDVCGPIGRPGEPCDPDGDPACTLYNDCVPNPDGGTDNICVPNSTVGGVCGAQGPTCTVSYCQADAGTCQPRQMSGASCTANGQCASLRCINPDGGTGDRSCVAACY